jgi:hypothetical protein
MPSQVFKIENGYFGLTITEPTPPATGGVCGALLADYGGPDAYSCQITSGALTASPNITNETVPSTWCSPEETVPTVGVTSFALDLSYLQDPQIVDGLSQFLFEHDTELAYFYMGLDGDDPPKATGQVRLVAGAIGGAGRVALTATVSLPVETKPSVCFGTATASEAVPAASVMATEATTTGGKKSKDDAA